MATSVMLNPWSMERHLVVVDNHYNKDVQEAIANGVVISTTTGSCAAANNVARPDRRHYKKDSRFVLDLYTLTYDSHESLDSIGDLTARRNGPDEIKERLSFISDNDEYIYDEPGPKSCDKSRSPLNSNSNSSRSSSGTNLDLWFKNSVASDNADHTFNKNRTNSPASLPPSFCTGFNSYNSLISTKNEYCSLAPSRRNRLFDKSALEISVSNNKLESDFCKRQEKLQSEARVALTRAKDEARKVLETERCNNIPSPITAMVRSSLKKVGMDIGERKRRVSRQLLTDMSINQLQSIVNDLQNHIEYLNESLVKLLMERDELYMKQDSMLVDIEDITRYMEGNYKFINYGKLYNKSKQVINHRMHTKVSTKLNRITNLIRS